MPTHSRTWKSVGERRAALRFGAVVGLSIAAACSAFDGLKLAASGTNEDTVGQTCVLAKAAKMAPTVPAAGGDVDFVVAIQSLDLGERHLDGGSPDFRNVGFDLDDKCTGKGQAPACAKPKWARDNPDGPGGRDNALGNFFATQDAGPQAPNSNGVAYAGGITAVMRITGYNGLPDDGLVTVAFYAATGCRLGDGGAPQCPGLTRGMPPFKWLGRDVWTPLADWTEPTSDADGAPGSDFLHPKYESTKAYVSNHILVAHLPTARMAVAMDFTDFWIQAKIVPFGSPEEHLWALSDGTLAGRAQLDDVLADVEFFIDPASGDRICMNSASYPTFKRRICSYADISSTGNDAAAPCDATSWAWTFQSKPAQLGPGVFPLRENDFRKCDAESPKYDHCNTLDDGAP